MTEELHQCPCCPSTKCIMDDPCLGCEHYAMWLLSNRHQTEYKYATFDEWWDTLDSSLVWRKRGAAQKGFDIARELKEK